jgi:hypothetical protein
MTVARQSLKAGGIAAAFEPRCGFLTDLAVEDEGQVCRPLHVAPWLGEPMPAGAPPHHARLQGDFFCAPFADARLPGTPLHGWPANGTWVVHGEADRSPDRLRAVLTEPVSGATLVKDLSVEDGHAFVYQRHIFLGGAGRLPVANHAMVTLPEGGLLSFSRKRWFETPADAPEPDPARGRSALAYPRRSEDLTAFPGAAGDEVNLARYPWGPAHEDFVIGIEEPASALGWTAVVRKGQGDLFLSLRNGQRLPQTMLWHSHGGRDYAPWNGRHVACLGVEEGAALHLLGLSSHEEPDPLSAAGQPVGLTLMPDGQAEVRHVIGAIAWPSGQSVAGIRLDGDMLTITGDWGAERKVPLRGEFLQLEDGPGAVPAAMPKRGDWDLG